MLLDQKRILVAFYSLQGHTKKVGLQIAKILGAEVEEIKDTKDRSMLKSWFQGAFNEELRTPTKIKPVKSNSLDYDLVVVGTPMWDGISPPVREYLKKNKFHKVAFFATFGSAADDAFYIMNEVSGKKPVTTLELQDRQIDLKEDKKRIDDFCKKIKRSLR